MDNLLNVSASPHVRDKTTTKNIMLYVIIALLPASLFGVYNFGFYSLMLILVCVGCCVGSEYIYQRLMKKKILAGDLSAAVTGLLLALNLPPELPLWMAGLGSVFAIIVVKQLFGGLGQNFMNPALAARCFLIISFTGRMTTFTYDGISGATPLAVLKEGGSVELWKMFSGTIAGTIGETSVIALVAGGIFLVCMGVISLRIPGTYLISFSIFTVLFSGHGFDLNYLAAQLCGGGLMLGAFFMATDYVTSPITKKGQYIYGCILGILTGIFRFFGASAEGVSYAIIFSNLLVPLIEKFTVPKAFGKGGERR